MKQRERSFSPKPKFGALLFVTHFLHSSFALVCREKLACMRDWSNLPSELLDKIATKLSNYNLVEIILFGAVCTSWRTISLLLKTRKLRSRALPWLMLYPPRNTTVTHHSFLNLCDKRIYNFELPTLCNVRFCGSSNGSLLVVDPNLGISLLNPITKSQVWLPDLLEQSDWLGGRITSFTHKQEKVIRKALVISYSSSSSVSNSSGPDNVSAFDMVVVMCRRFIALYEFGVPNWSFVSPEDGDYDDINYSDGKLYVVTHSGSVVVSHIATLFSKRIKGTGCFGANRNYIVESGGEVLMVSRYREQGRTLRFKVFKIKDQINNRDGKLDEIHSLGDCVLFLGRNQSFSLVASDFTGIKANYIYFSDSSSRDFISAASGPHDVGAFNFEDGCIEPFLGSSYESVADSLPPMWVETSPW